MYQPDLTTEAGMARIGMEQSRHRWVMDAAVWQHVRKPGGQVRDWMIQNIPDGLTVPMRAEIQRVLHDHLEELIFNAGEHGSVFGQSGPVHVEHIAGEQGELWLIDQPLPGPDLAVFKTRKEVEGTLLYDAPDRKHGVGHEEASADDPGLQVWFENKPDGGYRTVCFLPKREERS